MPLCGGRKARHRHQRQGRQGRKCKRAGSGHADVLSRIWQQALHPFTGKAPIVLKVTVNRIEVSPVSPLIVV